MSLATVRGEIVAQLALLGVPVHATVPSRLTTPCVLLTEGQPFIEPDTFGSATVTFTAVIVSRPGSNKAVTTELDNLVTTAIGHDPTIAVDRYEPVTHNQQEYLTAVLTIPATLNH